MTVGAVNSLSPSRIRDFTQCPLLYRYKYVDKLPTRPAAAAVRGTLVHAVLEKLYDLPAAQRTPDQAAAMVGPEWERLVEQEPEVAAFAGDEWLDAARDLVARYFTLEDPQRLEPAERELYVETTLESGLLLRGYVDRLDVAPTGPVRVVDYKTGKAPHPRYEAQHLFQMRFYALVLWRVRGVVPAMLQLVYLGGEEPQVLRYEPTADELLATERRVLAVWRQIEETTARGVWEPSPSRLCGWCDFRDQCPAWSG